MKLKLVLLSLMMALLAACGGTQPTEEAVETANEPAAEVATEAPATETEADAPEAESAVISLDDLATQQATDLAAQVIELSDNIKESFPEGNMENTASGLQYQIESEGSGPAAVEGDVVKVHYSGYLADGTKFDSSLDRNEPFTFPLGRGFVIPGWDEGVQLLNVGGKGKFIIPPELGYGAAGAGGVIPPNATLYFEVELLEIAEGSPDSPIEVSEADCSTTENNITICDINAGDGPVAETGSPVTIHFTGWLENGEKFDSSIDMGSPIPFILGRGQVLPGWDEAIVGMQAGGKRQMVIPPEMAFGDQGAGNVIPPDATLTFEIELLEVSQPLPSAPEAATEVAEDEYTETESGLKYYDFEVGDGASPKAGQTVVVNYTGWLDDGVTKFDSSLDRGETFSFALGVGQVIPGWDEGVGSMKVGGKRQLVIPADLAYGEQGAGGIIPANATLIFEVELVDIQ